MEDNYSPYLVLANVEVVHVDERNGITVLMFVKEDADLVERELDIKTRRFLVQPVVHGDLHDRMVSLTSAHVRRIVCTLPSPETGLSMN